MTEQEIDVFLTVVRTGSLSGAAQALYITQPAVSRHISALERELGCPLLIRGKGIRKIELTDHGRDFIDVAEKWRQIWQEARELASRDRNRRLNVASVGSISSYLLPPVFRTFLEGAPSRSLTFHNYHSQEAYEQVAQGLVDVALISNDMHHTQVETIPAFRTPMVLIAGTASDLPEEVHPTQLDPSKELRLPWNPEYDLWHSFWFSVSTSPRAELDQTSLLEEFLGWQGEWSDSWVIVPTIVADALQKRCRVRLRHLKEGPPDEIIYYLLGRRRKPELTAAFLDCLDRELRRRGAGESYLRKNDWGNCASVLY